MNVQTFSCGRLPNLNDYTRACRTSPHVGAQMKRDAESLVLLGIRRAHLKPVSVPVRFTFRWIEKNRSRDKDNIAFARKFIFDALVSSRVIPNDGWSEVDGWTDEFGVDRNHARVEVTIEEVER